MSGSASPVSQVSPAVSAHISPVSSGRESRASSDASITKVAKGALPKEPWKSAAQKKKDARNANIKECVKKLKETKGRGVDAIKEARTAVFEAITSTKAHPDLKKAKTVSVKAVTKIKFKTVLDNNGNVRRVLVGASSASMPVGVIVAGVLLSGEAIGAVVGACTKVSGPVGAFSTQMSNDSKAGAAAGSLAALAANALKAVKAIGEGINAGKELAACEGDSEKKGLQDAYRDKILEASSNTIGIFEKAIKVVQYLADKAFIHIKEFFLTVLKYLVPTFKILQGLIDIINGSLAEKKHKLEHNSFPTLEKQISNGAKIALGIVSIVMGVFTVIVAALSLVLSAVVMPVLSGIVGVLSLVKIILDLHAESSLTEMSAEGISDYLLTHGPLNDADAWIKELEDEDEAAAGADGDGDGVDGADVGADETKNE